MTTYTFSGYPASQNAGSYTGNLGRAFADLVGALFAARPQPSAQAKTVRAAEARDTINLARLYRLSSGRDSLNPALLAELKAISERDSVA